MTRLAVKASGLISAVGFNAPASLAAIRSGIRNVRESNLWDSESSTYLAAGKVPLPQWWTGLGKLADLAAPAVLECMLAAGEVAAGEIPVLLGVAPRSRPFRWPDLEAQILPEIEHRLEMRLHRDSAVVPADHVSVALALLRAGKLIESGRARYVIVAGVDSLLQHELKEHYLSQRRLLSPGNSNGFSPGEAGSAVLVSRATGAAGELQISGIGMAVETAGIESEEPLRAIGLTQAIRNAFDDAGLTYDDLDYRITDLNGEHYKFKEMVLAMMRFARKPKRQLFDLWHPIECTGDVGAAIGPMVLAVALDALRNDYGIGPTSLCTFGNDDGYRAAIIARGEPGRGQH